MNIQKFIPAPKEEVFYSFVDPKQLEQWCYPDGFSLKVPLFEAREGGRYRYEHTNDSGTFICTGEVLEYSPGEKLVSRDEKVLTPEGELAMENILSTLHFREKIGGTEITIEQTGFKDEAQEKECVEGWDQCLVRLTEFFGRNKNPQDEILSGPNVSP